MDTCGVSRTSLDLRAKARGTLYLHLLHERARSDAGGRFLRCQGPRHRRQSGNDDRDYPGMRPQRRTITNCSAPSGWPNGGAAMHRLLSAAAHERFSWFDAVAGIRSSMRERAPDEFGDIVMQGFERRFVGVNHMSGIVEPEIDVLLQGRRNGQMPHLVDALEERRR